MWVIDSCPPNADCAPFLNELTISANVGVAPPPAGAFVRVVASIEHLSGPTPINCRQILLVENLAAFGGLDNPTAADALPWLDPIDGSSDAFEATYSPFCSVQREPDPVCGDEDFYHSVHVAPAGDPDNQTDELLGGESDTLTVLDDDGNEVVFTASDALMDHPYCEQPGNEVVWVVRTE